jgi:hypothetical protein
VTSHSKSRPQKIRGLLVYITFIKRVSTSPPHPAVLSTRSPALQLVMWPTGSPQLTQTPRTREAMAGTRAQRIWELMPELMPALPTCPCHLGQIMPLVLLALDFWKVCRRAKGWIDLGGWSLWVKLGGRGVAQLCVAVSCPTSTPPSTTTTPAPNPLISPAIFLHPIFVIVVQFD